MGEGENYGNDWKVLFDFATRGNKEEVTYLQNPLSQKSFLKTCILYSVETSLGTV